MIVFRFQNILYKYHAKKQTFDTRINSCNFNHCGLFFLSLCIFPLFYLTENKRFIWQNSLNCEFCKAANNKLSTCYGSEIKFRLRNELQKKSSCKPAQRESEEVVLPSVTESIVGTGTKTEVLFKRQVILRSSLWICNTYYAGDTFVSI